MLFADESSCRPLKHLTTSVFGKRFHVFLQEKSLHTYILLLLLINTSVLFYMHVHVAYMCMYNSSTHSDHSDLDVLTAMYISATFISNIQSCYYISAI